MTTETRPSRCSGRPRDPDVDAAILGAAMRLLGEVGYHELSIVGVASLAGVGRPAIYRRYRSKADLVIAAILQIGSGPEPELPADPRLALRLLLGAAGAAVTSPGGMAALGSLLAEQRRDPALLAAFQARIFEPRRRVVRRVIERGIAAGVVDPAADLEAIDALLFGSLLARAILGEPMADAWIDRVVDQAWRGIGASASRVDPR